jgi:hypothetical protein
MPRITLRAAACTVIVSACSVNYCFAQADAQPESAPQAPAASAPSEMPSQATDAAHTLPADAAHKQAHASGPNVDQTGFHTLAGVTVHAAGPVPAPLYLPPTAPNITPTGYPYLNAPMYPCPLPYIPYQVGGTLVTNQAFDPHEMLYPHTYRSLYPPYYYEVSGGWKVFPWGVGQSETWRLRGTYVSVKYHSSWGLFSGWCPPALPTHGPWPHSQTFSSQRWSQY